MAAPCWGVPLPEPEALPHWLPLELALPELELQLLPERLLPLLLLAEGEPEGVRAPEALRCAVLLGALREVTGLWEPLGLPL